MEDITEIKNSSSNNIVVLIEWFAVLVTFSLNVLNKASAKLKKTTQNKQDNIEDMCCGQKYKAKVWIW